VLGLLLQFWAPLCWAVCMLIFLVTGYGDPEWASQLLWTLFWAQHSILLRILLRVIEGGGMLLALFISSLSPESSL